MKNHDDPNQVTVALTETLEAFPNPMKGFRPSRHMRGKGFSQGEYVTVIKHYIRYTDLEAEAEDTAQKIIDWSNAAWAGIEKSNLKVIPRVVLAYPIDRDSPDELFWPSGLDTSDPVGKWLTDAFLERIVAFIAKLGEAWDKDARVAAVEMGLWGRWGEHHIWPMKLPDGTDRIPPKAQKRMGAAFAKAFPNKKVMVRNPETFLDHSFGYYWDSFALPEENHYGEAMIRRQNWHTQMISGEVAYDWGDQSNLGGTPNGTLSCDAHTDFVIGWIRRTHTSSLGWIAEYDAGKDVSANAACMQKALGYRFVICQAAYTRTLAPGGTFALSFEVNNVGSAPFYYPWPVEVSLLGTDRKPVWRTTMQEDIRKWVPGCTFTVSGTFTLPNDLANGQYTLALTVLDPAGNLPALRFANSSYYNGGYTPLGAMGIGQTPTAMDIAPFDSLYDDRSLHYTLEK